ncbi:ABC transporter substrate-binding protein [Hydrogenophaga sp. 5NK40-0174]|uniref:ABC transporter substrate-binding protein n=1 Tax=Hydrogenophaga sp. 5NK40-0174 TaxID=3127649 RepID=UPI0031079591
MTIAKSALRALALTACLTVSVAQAEDGVSAREILLGQNITLKQGKSDYGVAVRQGVEVALKEINAAGGVHGRAIAIKVLDDDGSAENAAANAKELIEKDKVFALFGSVEGGPSTAVMKVALEHDVPFFGPMAGSPGLREADKPIVFPVRVGHREEFVALLDQARSLGITKVGFYRKSTATGEQHLANVVRHVNKTGMELVADLPFGSDESEGQVRATVDRIRASGAQMVFNHGSVSAYQRLIKMARLMGVKAYFYGVNSGSSQLADHLGDLSHGMVFAQVVPSPWERKTEITRAYQAAFKQYMPDVSFSYGSLEGYLTTKAMAEALKLAGPKPTRASFVSKLNGSVIKFDGLTISYLNGENPGLNFVDLALFTRRGRFQH